MKISITSEVIDQFLMGRDRHNIIELFRSIVGECHFLSELVCIGGIQYELPPAFYDWACNWHPGPITFTLKLSKHPTPDYTCKKHIPEAVAHWMVINPIVDMEAVHQYLNTACILRRLTNNLLP